MPMRYGEGVLAAIAGVAAVAEAGGYRRALSPNNGSTGHSHLGSSNESMSLRPTLFTTPPRTLD
jgi:hypothetical protein